MSPPPHELPSNPSGTPQKTPAGLGAQLRRTLLLPSVVIMAIGGLAAPLFTRIYFVHGGARIWLTTILQNCAFPILLLPLFCSYCLRRRRREGRWRTAGGGGCRTFSITGKAAAASVGLGFISGLDGYMYAYGSASLPLSTSSLLMSTQIAFTAAFAFLIVRHRFTPYSVNAVALLVMAPVVLGLQADGDRPAGVSRRRYYLGFVVMLGAAAVYGLLMPLIERTWMSMKKVRVTHVVVLEMQVVMAAVAAAFCAVGMLINKDFQAIPREAKAFGLGETKYYLVLAASAVAWQLMGVGFVGVIFCSSSLLAGVVLAVLVPLGEVLPVLLLHEKFNGAKGVAVALSLWGFVSYLYGEYRQHRREKQTAADEVSAEPPVALP